MRKALLVPAVLLAACQANNPTYFGPPAPIEVGQEGGMEAATSAVTLDFRPPSASEQQTLRDESRKSGRQVPWLRADHEALELIWTITNLSDRRGTAQIEIDGASELVSYDSAALNAAAEMANDEDAPVVLALISPTPVTVDPSESVSGTVGEDEFAEAALDLDAIGRWMATPVQVLINRSEMNRVGLEMVPPNLLVPAIYRVQVSFSATRHMRLEFLLRVRDEDRQLRAGQGGAFQPQPMAYAPPAPAMTPPVAMP